MEKIAEHWVDFDYLPPESWVLDVGCLHFDFYKHMKALGYNVVGVDIQHLSEFPYHRLAISDFNGVGYIEYFNDKQATRLSNKETPYQIQCMTLDTFSLSIGRTFWDLIKLDCEGAEYAIIMSLNRPPANQLSVEMHLHTGIYSDAQVEEMVHKLFSLGYSSISHEKSVMHGLKPNYWSSLFVLTDVATGLKSPWK